MESINIKGNRYYVINKDENIFYPSVTTILKHTTDKTGLIRWEQKVGKEEAERVRTKSANRGTVMHLLLELFLKYKFQDRLDLNDTDLIKKAIIDALNHGETADINKTDFKEGIELFRKIYGSGVINNLKDVLLQEVPLWAPYGGGYAGRVDLIARMNDDSLCVIDFKNSKKEKRKEWIENYFMQASAYCFAYFYLYKEIPKISQIWISNMENERIQVFELGLEELKGYFKKFLNHVRMFYEKFPK